MCAIRLRIFALLSGQGSDTLLVYLLDIFLDGFFNRNFDFILLVLINVTMDIDKSCLSRRARKEAKVGELISCQHLVRLLMLDHR